MPDNNASTAAPSFHNEVPLTGVRIPTHSLCRETEAVHVMTSLSGIGDAAPRGRAVAAGFLRDPERRAARTRELELGARLEASTVVCVMTRFQVRNPIQLLLLYRDYRRLIRQMARTRGLLRSTFLVESLRAACTLSIWDRVESIPYFGTSVPLHVQVARRSMGRVAMNGGRPQIWSTKWKLIYVSNNLNWQGFDLREAVVSAEAGGIEW